MPALIIHSFFFFLLKSINLLPENIISQDYGFLTFGGVSKVYECLMVGYIFAELTMFDSGSVQVVLGPALLVYLFQCMYRSFFSPLFVYCGVYAVVLISAHYHFCSVLQGMSDLLSPILFIMEDESESFWCFVALMERLGPNFNRDQNGMHSQLFALSKVSVYLSLSCIIQADYQKEISSYIMLY